MTRIAIDAATALRLIEHGVPVPEQHSLVGPNLLRSEALSRVYRSLRAGEIDQKAAQRLLDGIATMRIRLLGDRVSRRTALTIAVKLKLDDTAPAEYLAVAQLQSDALVTVDPALAALAEGLIDVADAEAIFGSTLN